MRDGRRVYLNHSSSWGPQAEGNEMFSDKGQVQRDGSEYGYRLGSLVVKDERRSCTFVQGPSMRYCVQPARI
jgi:hypothetical protein